MIISKGLILAAVIFLFCSSLLNAQSKDTSDYFAIGPVFGNYDSPAPSHNSGIINSAGLEIEYYKFSDLSFFAQGLYKFSDNGGHRSPHPGNSDYPGMPGFPPPNYGSEQILGINFGGKYFLRTKDINPFFELGLNQEFRLGSNYHYRSDDIYDNAFIPNARVSNSYNLSIGIGAGLSFKLDSKFKLEMKYDLYQNLSGRGGTGYALLLGGKYNL